MPRSHLYRILNHSANVLEHIPNYPKKLKKEFDPLIVGVELEVSTDYTIKELIDVQEDLFFAGKQDGSLSGSKPNLIELVTCPASIKYLKRHYALLFEKLDYNKFDCSVKTNNGMHVHVSREHFEDKDHIRNFIWFYNNPANQKFMFAISERPSTQDIQAWCPPWYFGDNTSKTPAFKNVAKRSLHNRGITNQKGGEHGKTIEVRLFKGIVSYATIVKNLEFVEATFEFTKSLTPFKELTLASFFKWLDNSPKNKYLTLKEFIKKEINIEKELTYANLKEVIFNHTNPSKIVELIEKSNLKITNDHIKILGQIRKGTFHLNKTSGKLELIPQKGGKLSSLDKDLASKYLRAKG